MKESIFTVKRQVGATNKPIRLIFLFALPPLNPGLFCTTAYITYSTVALFFNMGDLIVHFPLALAKRQGSQ
jgi:hypothetical protein